MELAGRVALVTGGAHRVGRAIALALAEAGADVAVAYHRSGDRAGETVTELRDCGVDAGAFGADLAVPSEAAGLAEAVAGRLGPVDALVNSASWFARDEFPSDDTETWYQTLDVVLHGGVLPHLGVHGRAHHHRCPRGEQRGGEQTVGDARGIAADDTCRSGGYDHHVGRLAQRRVRDRVVLAKDRRLHALAGQGVERCAAHESLRRCGHHRGHMGTRVHHQPAQDHCLVRGDATAHAQYHAAPGERRRRSVRQVRPRGREPLRAWLRQPPPRRALRPPAVLAPRGRTART